MTHVLPCIHLTYQKLFHISVRRRGPAARQAAGQAQAHAVGQVAGQAVQAVGQAGQAVRQAGQAVGQGAGTGQAAGPPGILLISRLVPLSCILC